VFLYVDHTSISMYTLMKSTENQSRYSLQRTTVPCLCHTNRQRFRLLHRAFCICTSIKSFHRWHAVLRFRAITALKIQCNSLRPLCNAPQYKFRESHYDTSDTVNTCVSTIFFILQFSKNILQYKLNVSERLTTTRNVVTAWGLSCSHLTIPPDRYFNTVHDRKLKMPRRSL
jgi:hypothetical protein